MLAAPNPANGTTAVGVAAVVDDGASGGSAVVAAEAFVDTIGSPGTGLALSGSFGGQSVGVSGSLAQSVVAGLPEGNHTVWVRGRDSAGNWGVPASTVLVIDRTGPSISGVGGVPNPSQGSTSVVVSGSAIDPQQGGASSPIVAVEWFEGPDPGAGAGHALSPSDGSFNGPNEGFGGSYATGGLSYGEHVLHLRARDVAGTWGSVTDSALSLTAADGIFADGFETGTLSAWSSTSGGSRLKVLASAALVGRYGLSVQISGSSTSYVSDSRPAAEAAYRARFWFAPRGTLTGGNSVDILTGRSSGSSNLFRVQYRRSSGGQPQIRAGVATSGGTTWTSWFTIADATNSIEIGWQAASNATFTLAIDGATRQTLTGLATSANRLETVRLGPTGGLASGMTGTLFFDGFVSTRTSQIGQ